MKKKLVSVLAGICALSLVACGSSSSGTTTAATSSAAASSEAATTAAASGQSDSASASGEDFKWPTKTLQLICPFKAGGDTDANARWVAQYLSKELGIDVVVTNQDGNGGAVGARAGHDAPNDGSVALFDSSAFVANQLSGAIDFGMDDFEFSCIASKTPGTIVCVNKSLGVNTFQELIDKSKEEPGKLTLAYDQGATTHIMALQMLNAGLDATMIDAGGSADRIAALLGGHVDIINNSYGSVKDYLTNGDFIGLGLTGDTDAKYIPDYKSLKSQGFDVAFPSYSFIAFPKGTDPKLAEKVSEACKNFIENNTEYQQAIKDAYGQEPTYYDTKDGLELLNKQLTDNKALADQMAAQ